MIFFKHKIRQNAYIVEAKKRVVRVGRVRMRLGNEQVARLIGSFAGRKLRLEGIHARRVRVRVARATRNRSGFIWIGPLLPFLLPLSLPLLRGERRGERMGHGRAAAAVGTCPLQPPGQGLQSLEDLGGLRVIRDALESEGTTTSGRSRG